MVRPAARLTGMSLVIVLVALVLAVAAGWLVVTRLAAGDGGPHRPAAPRVGDHWSTELPDRPYASDGLVR